MLFLGEGDLRCGGRYAARRARIRLAPAGRERRHARCRGGPGRAYHLIPRASSKPRAVARHMQARGYTPEECIAVGDSREDLGAAEAVGTFWLVANATRRGSRGAAASPTSASPRVARRGGLRGGDHDAGGAALERGRGEIAAAVRSMSASVVDQFDTEMRIAAWPCQRVPPTQHVPSACTRPMTASVVASSRTESQQHLVQHDVVQDLDPGRGRSRRPAAAPARSTAPPARPPRPGRATAAPHRPRTRAPGATPPAPSRVRSRRRRPRARGRRRRIPIAARWAARSRTSDDAAVVGDVEPLVAVGGPRVGALDARRQVPAAPGRRGPQPERAVDVDPGAVRRARAARSSPSGSNAPVLTLPAWAQTIVGPSRRQSAGERVGAHRALPVGGDPHDRRRPKPEQPQRASIVDVRLLADDDAQRRRAVEPVRLDVPAGAARARRAAPPRGRSRSPSARR